MNITSGDFTLLALLLVHSFSLGFLGIQYSSQNHNTNWCRLAPQSPWLMDTAYVYFCCAKQALVFPNRHRIPCGCIPEEVGTGCSSELLKNRRYSIFLINRLIICSLYNTKASTFTSTLFCKQKYKSSAGKFH